MASKMLSVILGSALAVSVSGMAVAQNTKATQPNTDESADSANRNQQPTGQRAAPSGQTAPRPSGSGAQSGSSDLSANPAGSGGAQQPIQPLTDEEKTSAEPRR